MKEAVKAGLGFGLTSGIITTLGLIVGLVASNASKLLVIGGILTIAVADSFSDALGMHISQESEKKNSRKFVWQATISTFFFKVIFALSFIIPVLFFSLSMAIVISSIWGILLLSIFSYIIAKQKKENPYKAIFEHVFIAVLVIIITHFVGRFIDKVFIV